MDIAQIGFRLFLAFALGAVLGLEREINERKVVTEKQASAVVGLRTFSLITVLGSIVGLLSFSFMPLALLIAGAFFLLLIVFYIVDSQLTKDQGMTTEIAMLYSFIIGLLLMIEAIPIQLTLAVTIIVILLLSQKAKIKDVVKDIQNTELNAFISFAVLALVILPFLPNISYSLTDISGSKDFLKNFNPIIGSLAAIDIINPFKLWLIVVLVTGVDLIGYVLEKTIGQKKGWLIASIAGGFVSSTATTQSLAQASKNVVNNNHLIAAAVLANIVSFFQIAFLIGSINGAFLVQLLPVLGAIVGVGLIILFYFLTSREKKTVEEKIIQEPKKASINLSSALKFAFLFLGISIFSKIALVLFGESGFLIATGFGSLIGLDAVMINTAQLVGENIELTSLAILSFLLANAVNLIAKSAYSFVMGKKDFAIKFSLSMSLIIISSVLAFLFF